MTICIRPHDVGFASAQEIGKAVNELGFDGVQLAIAKAIKGQNGEPDTLTEDVCKEIREGFESNNVKIPVLGAYFNPVHSDKAKVKAGQAKFADHLKKASLLGAKFVASETGSYNDEPWTYNPKNQTEEAYQEVKKIFTPLAITAKESGSYVSVEGAWHHCIYCPKQMKRLLDELNAPELGDGHVYTTVDIFNYLYIGNYEQRFEILDEALSLLKDKIACFHIKDFKVENGELVEVALGKGIMGWDKMIEKIQKVIPEPIVIFEGVPEKERSLQYFKSIIK
mgnify:CR=1 FL=1